MDTNTPNRSLMSSPKRGSSGLLRTRMILLNRSGGSGASILHGWQRIDAHLMCSCINGVSKSKKDFELWS
jgi:hypothetical protein